MHDCALGREGEPSAPRVEHIYYTDDGLNGKKIGEGVEKLKPSLFFSFWIENSKNQGQKDYKLRYF